MYNKKRPLLVGALGSYLEFGLTKLSLLGLDSFDVDILAQ